MIHGAPAGFWKPLVASVHGKVPGGAVERISNAAVAPRPFFSSFLSMRGKRLSEQRNARVLIEEADGKVKATIVMEKLDAGKDEPVRILDGAGGVVAKVVGNLS